MTKRFLPDNELLDAIHKGDRLDIHQDAFEPTNNTLLDMMIIASLLDRPDIFSETFQNYRWNLNL